MGVEGPSERRQEPCSWTSLGLSQTGCGRGSRGICPGAPTLIPPTLWLEASGGGVASEEDPGQSLGLP